MGVIPAEQCLVEQHPPSHRPASTAEGYTDSSARQRGWTDAHLLPKKGESFWALFSFRRARRQLWPLPSLQNRTSISPLLQNEGSATSPINAFISLHSITN